MFCTRSFNRSAGLQFLKKRTSSRSAVAATSSCLPFLQRKATTKAQVKSLPHRCCVRTTFFSPLSRVSLRTADFDRDCGGELFFRRFFCGWPSDLPPATEWGYLRRDGPSTWHEKYPEAGGVKQSPVDIRTPDVQSSNDLNDQPLALNYVSTNIPKSILNSGQGWRVDVHEGVAGISGGPLEHNYELVQFHCHWGDAETCGSEHTIDGRPHVGELHFVHWNKDLYSKCSDAVRGSKGLCVIGVFLNLGDPNPEIEKICASLKDIPYRDQRVEMPGNFDLNTLFPDDHSYWSYDGSLTTPPCYESVTWVVMKQPISVSSSQLQSFRALHTYSENEDIPHGEFKGKVLQNYRPPQDLNDRIIMDCPLH